MFLRVSLAVLLLSTVALIAEAGDDCAKYQTECPVMGGKIDKSIYEDHEGKRVYFCCESCREEFKKDPDKYINKMEEAGVRVYDAEVADLKCPVTGEPVNKDVYTEYKGEKVYFCCEECKAKFEEDPEKYMKAHAHHAEHSDKKTGCPAARHGCEKTCMGADKKG